MIEDLVRWARRRAGGGTEFEFTLRAVAEASEKKRTNPEKEILPRIGLLIVEDQGMVRAFFQRLFGEGSRFAVSGSARSGEEACSGWSPSGAQ